MANKRARSPPSRTGEHQPSKKLKFDVPLPRLPDEVVIDNILTRVPHKSLCRFKSVCKDWNLVIFNDPHFIMLRSRLTRRTQTSSSTISLNDLNSLCVIGDQSVHAHKILASNNEMLCLCCSSLYAASFLCLYNLATKEVVDFIPSPPSYSWHKSDSIGLVFDPSKSPKQYMLVHPVQYEESGVNIKRYRFMTFSSDNREWIEHMDQVMDVDNSLPTDPIFANGILYWNCTDYLLWFDCENKISGCTTMPEERSWSAEQAIGVCEGWVTCARMCETSLDVWMLNHESIGDKWEKIYFLSLEKVLLESNNNVEALSLFLKTTRPVIRTTRSQTVITRYRLVPLPFKGGEEVFFNLIARLYDQEEQLKLRYDINTRKLEEVFKDGPVAN